MSGTIHISEYKRRKALAEREDKPTLYVNHATGKVTGSPETKQVVQWSPQIAEDRLERIRASLIKINNLMNSLKELSNERKV